MVEKIKEDFLNKKRINSYFFLCFVNDFIKKKSKEEKDLFFIQIGSNDGITNDPLYKYIKKYNWRGIVVEPIKYIFERLVKNYEGKKKIICENIAIAEKEGYKYFYRIKENNEKMPSGYEQIGSFKSKVVFKHKKFIPNFDKFLIKEKIRCITLQKLIKKYNLKKIDLLHLDIEGYDYIIIKSIKFDLIKPKMILYEHIHLNKKDKNDCINLLKRKGYMIISGNNDTFAYIS